MLSDTFPEGFHQTRLVLSPDDDDVVLNLSPVQQYLVFTLANRNIPDEVESTLPE